MSIIQSEKLGLNSIGIKDDLILHRNLSVETLVDDIISISKSYNFDAQIIGRVKQCQSVKKLTISSKFGTFEY